MAEPLFIAIWSLDASDRYFLGASSSIASCMKWHGKSIRYGIVTTRELTPFQRYVMGRVTETYGSEIELFRVHNLAEFSNFTGTWPPIVFAKLLLGEQFDLPYMAVDADVLWFGRIEDIGFLKTVASIGDPAQLRRGRLAELNAAFGTSADVYLNVGSLMVAPHVLNPSLIGAFLTQHGEALVTDPRSYCPEQDALAVLMAGQLQYYPEGYGILLYADRTFGRAWREREVANIRAGRYCFAHLLLKQWLRECSLHDVHLAYLAQMGLHHHHFQPVPR